MAPLNTLDTVYKRHGAYCIHVLNGDIAFVLN